MGLSSVSMPDASHVCGQRDDSHQSQLDNYAITRHRPVGGPQLVTEMDKGTLCSVPRI